MSNYTATTTFSYKTSGMVSLGERYPAKTIKIETNCDDLDAHELLDLFKDFMVGCGYAEKSFYDACDQAVQENPYRSGNGSKLGETNLPYPYGQTDYNKLKKEEDNYYPGCLGDG